MWSIRLVVEYLRRHRLHWDLLSVLPQHNAEKFLNLHRFQRPIIGKLIMDRIVNLSSPVNHWLADAPSGLEQQEFDVEPLH